MNGAVGSGHSGVSNPKETAVTRTFALLALLLTGCFGPERVVQDQDVVLEDASAIRYLEVDVGAGDLHVIGDPDASSIRMDLALATNRLDEEDDEAAIESMRITFDPADDVLRAGVHLQDAPHGYHVNVCLTVPEGLEVAVTDRSGDAFIANVASLDLVDGSGDLEVLSVRGPVTIDDDSGEIRVEVVGPLRITDESGEIEIRGVTGDAEIHDGSGELELSDVDGDVTIADGSGTIEVRRVTGSVTIEDGSGDIELEDVGEFILLSDGSGSIDRD